MIILIIFKCIARAEEEFSVTTTKINNQTFASTHLNDGPDSLNSATFVSVVSFFLSSYFYSASFSFVVTSHILCSILSRFFYLYICPPATKKTSSSSITRVRFGQGGDKLTLNLMGPTIMNNNTTTTPPSSTSSTATTTATTTTTIISTSTTTTAPLTTPSTAKHFTLLQPDITTTADVAKLNQSQNGVSVTHYSEQRGAIEKISIASPKNIFNAEIKSPKLDNSTHSNNLIQLDDLPPPTPSKNNNPFLNMSPQLTPTTPINVHNPFKSTSAAPSIFATISSATAPMTGGGQNPFRNLNADSNGNRGGDSIDSVVLEAAPALLQSVMPSASKKEVTTTAKPVVVVVETEKNTDKKVSLCVFCMY